MDSQIYRKKKIVQMTPNLRRAVRRSKYWYRPLRLALFSPVSVVLVLRSLRLTLPWFLTHPASMVYLTAISLAFIWVRHRRTLAATVLLLVFIFSSNRHRTEINDYFRG